MAAHPGPPHAFCCVHGSAQPVVSVSQPMKDPFGPQRFIIDEKLKKAEEACAYLAQRTGLPKGRVKDAMNKGALRWRKGGNGSMKRLRRATTALSAGDDIAFYYDESLLSIKPLVPECIADEGQYSVWYKPADLLSQGNEYGDHCSLLRQAELLLEPRREAWLVHRLDREATGLMLVAHASDAAGKLSQLFSGRDVEKRYWVKVAGIVGAVGDRRTLDFPLDDKAAVSHVRVLEVHEGSNTSLLEVTIDTGRKHQIRRHLAQAGFPVVGDERYGGPAAPMLCLTSMVLRFKCPLSGKQRDYSLNEDAVEWIGL